MKHINNQFRSLRAILGDHPEIKKLENLVNGELCKLTSRIEVLSKGEIGAIEIVESTSARSRLTVAPNLRTTLKISPKVQSEKVRGDFIKIAEYARDNYKGHATIRGSIDWVDDQYICRLSSENGGVKLNLVMDKDGVIEQMDKE